MKKILSYLAGAELGLFQAFVQFKPLATGADQGRLLGNLYQSQSLVGYVNALFTTAITVGAILAVGRIAWGGYIYMTSEVIPAKGNAKTVISNAIVGLLLLLAIWLILNQINPDILNLDVLKDIN